MQTVFDLDPTHAIRYPLQGSAREAHGHLHSLPDAHRVHVIGGPRHEHQFKAAVLELVTDATLDWADDEAPSRVPRLREGFIYAASYEEHGGRVKIGRTGKLPEQRLADLERRTAAPAALHLLYAIQTPMMTDVEAALHRAQGHHRKKGEWFKMDPAALLASVLGIAHAHDMMKAECRVWMSSHALGTMSPDDMRLLRAAGLGRDLHSWELRQQIAVPAAPMDRRAPIYPG